MVTGHKFARCLNADLPDTMDVDRWQLGWRLAELVVQTPYLGEDAPPPGYIGVAHAPNKRALFWAIDHYGDPDFIKVQSPQRGSFRMRLGNGEHDEYKSAYETTASLPFTTEPCWRQPNWEAMK